MRLLSLILKSVLTNQTAGVSDAETEVDEDLLGIEEEHRIDELSHQIQYLISKTASMLMESSPYPSNIFRNVEELLNIQSSIKKSFHSKLYQDSLLAARDFLFFDEQAKLLDKEELSIRHGLFNHYEKNEIINLIQIQDILLDKYFFQIKDYWEAAISELKQKSAVRKRREYLIIKLQEFKNLLASKGIDKYNVILDDYIAFNRVAISQEDSSY